MNREFIPYEQALTLKELGFDEPCLAWYGSEDIFEISGRYKNSTHSYCVSVPLYQQAFRWFREKYELPSWIYTSNNKEFWYSVLKDGRMIVRDYKPFNTYEEAELACLNKLIQIAKEAL